MVIPGDQDRSSATETDSPHSCASVPARQKTALTLPLFRCAICSEVRVCDVHWKGKALVIQQLPHQILHIVLIEEHMPVSAFLNVDIGSKELLSGTSSNVSAAIWSSAPFGHDARRG